MNQADQDKDRSRKLRRLVDDFCALEGRQPRVMVSGRGQGVPGLEAAKLANRFADLGFNVDFGPMCSTATDLFRQSLENGVDIICLAQVDKTDLLFLNEICELSRQMKSESPLLAMAITADQIDAPISGQSECFMPLGKDDPDPDLHRLLQTMMRE